jgi:hypothetical protein
LNTRTSRVIRHPLRSACETMSLHSAPPTPCVQAPLKPQRLKINVDWSFGVIIPNQKTFPAADSHECHLLEKDNGPQLALKF